LKTAIAQAVNPSANAFPIRPPIATNPLARARPTVPNHEPTNRVIAGYAPASANPHAIRTITKAANPCTHPVIAVHTDHNTTYVTNIRRGPNRSAIQPAGICPNAYAKKKDDITDPTSAFPNAISF
jgi:hypothetical protein